VTHLYSSWANFGLALLPSLTWILTATLEERAGRPESLATIVSWMSCFMRDAGIPLLLAYRTPVVCSTVKPFTGVKRE